MLKKNTDCCPAIHNQTDIQTFTVESKCAIKNTEKQLSNEL